MRVLFITEKVEVKKVLIKFNEFDLIALFKEVPEVKEQLDINPAAGIDFYLKTNTNSVLLTDEKEEKVYVENGFPLTMELTIDTKPLPEN